jgi:hypothetical protein
MSITVLEERACYIVMFGLSEVREVADLNCECRCEQDISPKCWYPCTLRQAWSTFYVVRTISVKFGVHAGKVKFNTQNEE